MNTTTRITVLFCMLVACAVAQLAPGQFSPADGASSTSGARTITWGAGTGGNGTYNYTYWSSQVSCGANQSGNVSTTSNSATITLPASGTFYFNVYYQGPGSAPPAGTTYCVHYVIGNPENVFTGWTGINNNWSFSNLPVNTLYANLEVQFKDTPYGETAGTGIYVWFTGADGKSCQVGYQFGPNQYVLWSEDWQTITYGGYNSGTYLTNNKYCTLNTNALRVGTVGSPYNVFLADFPVTFSPAFAGAREVRVLGQGAHGGSSGWQTIGTWNVPAVTFTSNMTSTQTDNGTGGDIPMAIHGKPIAMKSTAKTRTYRLPSGGTVDVPRGDLAPVDNFDYNWKIAGGDRWDYGYHGSNIGLYMMRVGDGFQLAELGPDRPRQTGPKGASGMGLSWFWTPDAEHQAEADYSINSRWAPGLVEVYFLSMNPTETEAITHDTPSIDEVQLSRLYGMQHNALRKPAIGPAFPPGISGHVEDIMKFVAYQVETIEAAAFLKPLLEGARLDDLEATTKLQKDVVQTLRDIGIK